MFYPFMIVYLTLIAMTVPSFLFPMDPPEWMQQAQKKTSRAARRAQRTAQQGIRAGRKAVSNLFSMNENFLQSINFDLLPKDVQSKVINLITRENNAQTLEEAVYAIQSLSLVNNNLYQLINNPHYHIDLVRDLSMRFNTFDNYIYQLLRTPQAQRQSQNNNELTALSSLFVGSPSREFLKIIKTIINQNKMNVNFNVPGIGSPLSLAIAHQSLPLVKLLVKKGADMHLFIPHTPTPFLLAASLAKTNETALKILAFLVQKVPAGTIDLADEQKKNALCYAIEMENIQAVKILLDGGADPHFNNDTPVAIAEKVNNKEILNLLSKY